MKITRRFAFLFSIYAVLACSACGEHDARNSGSISRETAFQKKKFCAELGRQRLALDRRKDETESEGVSHFVKAEWCFSTDLNTCIYSSTNDVVIIFDPNVVASTVSSLQSTIDLLTNRELISIERIKAKRTKIEEYERRKRELFSKCL